MRIAILGAGNIGGTLGGSWIKAGHEVVYGVRDVNSSKTASALKQAPGAEAMDISTSIPGSNVVLFSVPWKNVTEIARANAADLNGKVLIDATNNFAGPVINNLQVLMDVAPNARIYRAFNSLGWEVFANPLIHGRPADMFYSGPDGETRTLIHSLIEAVGLNPIWVGENDRIHLVDNLGALWVNMVFQHGWKRHTAFQAVTE
jgi:8-hydroxy-5-deazaflavin:NADPH oxidoreductase